MYSFIDLPVNQIMMNTLLSQLKCRKKKAGRKAMWSENALDDFVDIITGSEYYKKKLIFTNIQKNDIIYEKILTELRTRCDERNETIKNNKFHNHTNA